MSSFNPAKRPEPILAGKVLDTRGETGSHCTQESDPKTPKARRTPSRLSARSAPRPTRRHGSLSTKCSPHKRIDHRYAQRLRSPACSSQASSARTSPVACSPVSSPLFSAFHMNSPARLRMNHAKARSCTIQLSAHAAWRASDEECAPEHANESPGGNADRHTSHRQKRETPSTPSSFGIKSPSRVSSSHGRTVSDTASLFREYKRGSSKSPATPRDMNSSVPVYSDRHIPSRLQSNLQNAFIADAAPATPLFGHASMAVGPGPVVGAQQPDPGIWAEAKDESSRMSSTYNLLLRTELLSLGPIAGEIPSPSPTNSSAPSSPPQTPTGAPQQQPRVAGRTLHFQTRGSNPISRADSRFSISPVSTDTQRLLAQPRKAKRKIPKTPFKVLDAPGLKDDFYLDIVDWSSQNVLAVGLGTSVYLWSACTSKVTKLCDLSLEDGGDSVSSLSWTHRGQHLAMGTQQGRVLLWDVVKQEKVRDMGGHEARVGALSWNNTMLASGGRDRKIYLRDPRSPSDYTHKRIGHRQEVCGLKWSPNDQNLASGGNDNRLLVWSLRSPSAVVKFTGHSAAVKAIAWSHHQHGVLASGGGTADRSIRFWNTLTSTPLSSIDTGSQVCKLLWSRNVNELVSTHGYSLNQIICWKYPTMQKIATLTGHTYRVLYMACSPDGQTVVTGAGDETLRFWNMFPSVKRKGGPGAARFGQTLSFPSSSEIR